MRKLMLLAALLAVLVVAALPALAQNRGDGDNRNNHKGGDHKGSDHKGGYKGGGYKGGGYKGGDEPAVAQENELDVESGDIDQKYTVVNTGDNANQCVGINGTANTGNAQNVTGVLQYASEADDFEFEDSGSKLDVSGDSTTTCDQEVNQASAAG